MHVTIVTLFPEYFDSVMSTALMAKALERGVVRVDFVDPRDFAEDRHRTVDDKPYGGGPGMVMRPDVVGRALESVESPGLMVQLTPRGRPLDQSLARDLAAAGRLTLVCGRYEGIDARVEAAWDLLNVSVGDFVLSGGEAAALCLLEATARLTPGFMGHEDSGEEESFSAGLLEYPQYTRPEEWNGRRVPRVLTSGDHGRIQAWRREESLRQTLARRPDLLQGAGLDRGDVEALRRIARHRLGRGLWLCLVHWPVLLKDGRPGAVSLTNLDIHDMSRVSRSYGLAGVVVVQPLADQRELLDSLLAHWREGAGARANPDRAEALSLVRGASTLEEAVAYVTEQTGVRPGIAATTARGAGDTAWVEVRQWLERGPVLLLAGTGHGLAPEVLDAADGVLRPLRYMDGYNHMPVRSAVAIALDRILGDAY
jgi:tRNA (guanine37-N1)-methyltransferase